MVPLEQLATGVDRQCTDRRSALMRLGSEGWARAALVAAALAAGALVARAPAAPRMGDRRGRRCRPRAPVGRRRRSDRRRVGARGASGDRLRAPTWLDDAGLDDATLLVTGDRLWTATARTIFWNRGIVEAVRLAPATTPFPPVTASVRDRPRRRALGRIRDAARAATRRHAVDDHARRHPGRGARGRRQRGIRAHCLAAHGTGSCREQISPLPAVSGAATAATPCFGDRSRPLRGRSRAIPSSLAPDMQKMQN